MYTQKIQVIQYVGWFGSWVMIVVILWVGLGLYVCGLGSGFYWVMKMDPWTTLRSTQETD